MDRSFEPLVESAVVGRRGMSQTVELQKLLEFMIEKKASDLHVIARKQPGKKIHVFPVRPPPLHLPIDNRILSDL